MVVMVRATSNGDDGPGCGEGSGYSNGGEGSGCSNGGEGSGCRL